MTERDALLRAVCENPDDDTPRLVFADWLQENGDEPRAEFIRAECLIRARNVSRNDWRRRSGLSRQLLKTRAEKWRAELPQSAAWEWGKDFDRGFIQAVTVNSQAVLAEVVEAVFAATPLRKLAVKSVTALGAIAEIGRLHQLAELTLFCDEISIEEIEDFGRSRLAKAIRWFKFVHSPWQLELQNALDAALDRRVFYYGDPLHLYPG